MRDFGAVNRLSSLRDQAPSGLAGSRINPAAIEAKAVELAQLLRVGLEQESFTVQTPTKTTWFSFRAEDQA